MNAPMPYYSDESVTLYHGDCREITAWLDADVLITDPPYGVAYSDKLGQTIANDRDFTVTQQALSLWRDRPMTVFANHASLLRTLCLVSEALSRVRVATWHKTNVNGAAGMGNPWFADVEFAICGVTEWPSRPVSGLISARRFTGNPASNSSPDAYLHPTQKPIPVMESLLLAMPEGVVADPFAGSGTTLRAARNLGRHAIGVEIEERYCEIAARRLAQGVLDFEGTA